MNPKLAALTLMISLFSLLGCATRPGLPADEATADRFILERDLAGKTVGRGALLPSSLAML